MKKIKVILAKAVSPKESQEKANKSLDKNFTKFMLDEIEIRRKLLQPGIFKRK